MKVTMLLADAAQACEGKLNILGGGWSLTGPEPTPSAIAMLIEVPWSDTNRRHVWRLELVDSDGNEIDPGRKTVALCRCGKSGIKPFCDGTHKRSGFSAGSAPSRPRPAARLFDRPRAEQDDVPHRAGSDS
jgi:CDGSH-type Zn-finger protein